MSSLFDSLINARLDGTRFSFYTDEEIEAISVKEIGNAMAYDQLGNPNPGGLCDEALGVSAMDKFTICKTCGCDSVHCPGHLGHIKLISTCYNPFTINLLQKLLRAKCQMCHKIRIYPKKIELLEIRLRLIKLGYIVEAAKLGEYTDFSTDSAETSLRMLKKKLNAKSRAKDAEGDEEMDAEKKDETLTALENITEKEKEQREIFFSQIRAILEENEAQSSTNISITIAIKELLRELMGSVIPSR
jgi:DNA-directed RNA polymerase I subunit RPA1